MGEIVLRPITGMREHHVGLSTEARILASTLRRHAKLIALLFILGGALGLAASFLKAKTYDGVVEMSLDPRRVAIGQPMDAQTQKRDEPLIDSGRADTEAEVMQSASVVKAVVETLGLQNNKELTEPHGPLAYLFALLLPPGAAASPEDRINGAISIVTKNLKVERVDKSYAYLITYTSTDPTLAATIANAIGNQYIGKQLDADYYSTQQAVSWLKGTTDKLAGQLTAADNAAGDFQRSAAIARQDGKLIDEQQLSTISDQVADAMTATAEAKARLDRVQRFSIGSGDELAVSEAAQNTVITTLRSKYFDLQNEADTLASKYGAQNGVVIKMRANAEAVQNSIRKEMLRYQESYRNDYEVAVEKEKAARDRLADQTKKTEAVYKAQVTLNGMESDAKNLRATYDTLMQRYNEALQHQTFPISEARIITSADVPDQPSGPKRLIFAAAGAFLGLLGGLGTAFTNQLITRKIWTRAEAEAAAGVECLGYIPQITRKDITSRRAVNAELPIDYFAENPHTIGAETLRTMKTVLDYKHQSVRCPVVGMISCVPNEGKTSISANMAYVLAQGGKSVLLIDADLRNPMLSNALASGLGTDGCQLARTGAFTAVRRPDLPFDFIPSLRTSHVGFAEFRSAMSGPSGVDSEMGFNPSLFQNLVTAAESVYDYVIVDLPPIVPLSDVRAISRSFTAFFLVMAWGESRSDIVSSALPTIPGIGDKLLGSLLNKADINALPRYGEYISTYYTSNYFAE